MFQKLILIIRHPILANSFYLYLSNFADYLFALFILPFIARTLGIVELGEIGLAQTFGIFILLFMEFGFSLMATRKIAREKENLNKINFFICQVITFKIYLIPLILIISGVIILLVPTFYYKPHYIIIVVIGAIFQGFSPSWYFQGIEKMRKIALSKIIFRLLGLIVIIFFVRSPNEGWVVLGSYSLSSAFICIYLFLEMIKKTGKIKLVRPWQAKIVFDKSKYSFLITTLPVFYQNVSMFTLSVLVNPIQLGFYYGINRIYRAFNTLYGPVGQAFYPRISVLGNENKFELTALLKKFFWGMLSVGLIFFIILFLFSEQMVFILLGEKFLPANNTLKVFGIVLPLTAISHVLGRQWLMSISKDSYYAFSQLVSSLIAFISFLLMIKKFGIISVPISLIIFELISIISILVFIKNNENY